ncbi:FliG C-terminal domain-containing protein [Frigidibacter sp. MR17.14]|uniref:flagellar motor switch protein FliG n=1 Tax=Frigidibacter sp. MR17.14 TaxID=3126509 RepID=UPI003012DFF5
MADLTPFAPRGGELGFGRDIGLTGRLSGPKRLSGREKAAIIVRLLLQEGADVPLADLPEDLQGILTEQIGTMRSVDRETLDAVVAEFIEGVEAIGLSFPDGLTGALDLLGRHLSAGTASRLRRIAGATQRGDPWQRIAGLEPDRLLPVLNEESIEIGAVLLSKLSVAKAAQLLERLPGDRARRIAYAVSLTGNIDPDTVLRIGQSLAAQLDAEPPKAFADGPVQRVGAILNQSKAATREDVLAGLDETDQDFANEVRKAIFTFANIPKRIEGRDIPKVVKGIEAAQLVIIVAGAQGPDREAAEYILSNMSQRMAQSIREEAQSVQPKAKDLEAAYGSVVAAIRGLEDRGELFLIAADEG